jgi:fumarylpyruvate hydrolase
MNFGVTPTSVPIVGGGDFPVRRLYCVGRNYRAHALEMGGDPDRELPFFFLKPTDAVVCDGATVPYPPMTNAYEHEVELVVAIGRDGSAVSAADAPGLIFGYAVGLDMTRRDLQIAARKAGRPWDMGKGFDHSAPCGAISRKSDVGLITKGAIRLTVNDEIRQASDLSFLIWSVSEIITHLSRYVTLKAGDLIYTGTPENVGPVSPGDRMHGHIDGLTDLRIAVAG